MYIFTDQITNKTDSSSEKGDCSQKGVLTLKRALHVLLLQYVASKVQLTETQMQAADVDQNGNVTSNDATLLLRIVAGIASFN